MRKLPYIPDKDMYAAVVFACKMVRETRQLHVSCRKAANYYGVDANEVERYVRIAQSNGQRIANERRGKRTYHWFAVLFVRDYASNPDYGSPYRTAEHTPVDYLYRCHWKVVRALNQGNAEHNVMGIPKNSDLAIEDGGFRFNRVLYSKEFVTKKEADAYVDSVGEEELKEIIDEFCGGKQ